MVHLLARAMACLFLTLLIWAPRAGCAAERLALVIGNDNYESAERLETARNDARDIARALERFHFHVTLRLDLNEKGMRQAVRGFKAAVQPGDVAVFYFSGHGAQFDAASYLLPVDIRGDDAEQVKDDSLPLQRVLDALAERKAGFLLAIIDACRNNPFQPSAQSRHLHSRDFASTPGVPPIPFAPAMPASGQMVVFSAAAGQDALDRLDDGDHDPHGVFARVLLKEMEQAGVPVDRLLRRVRAEVLRLARSAGHEQVPAVFDQTVGDFFFQEPALEPAVLIRTPVAPRSPVAGLSRARVDDDAWQTALRQHGAEAVRSYLAAFPHGRHAAEARSLLPQHQAAGKPALRTQLIRPGPSLAMSRPQTAKQLHRVAVPVALATSVQSRPDRPAQAKPIDAVLRMAPGQAAAQAIKVIASTSRTPEYQRRTGVVQRADKSFSDCANCPRMVIVPAGAFPMRWSDPESKAGEGPPHDVRIEHPFAMSRSTVTQGEWLALMGTNPSYFDHCGDDCPVEQVSWDDIQTYITRLNQATGRHYRLPSEAEWEFACRGNSGHDYCGSDDIDEVAWYARNSAWTTHPIGLKQANPFGLDDMSGNVEQWLQDCYHQDLGEAPADGSAWSERSCRRHVVRGSAWNLSAEEGRLTHRSSLAAGARSSMVGLRLVRAID